MGVNILLGAVGAFYASRLHQPEKGVHVSVVCRSNYKAVLASGFRLKTRAFGEYSFKPQAVFPSCKAAAEANPNTVYDYVVIATKALPDIDDEPQEIAPVVTPGRSSIVLIQNGVGIEAPHRARFPTNPILSAVTVISAAQTEPGVVVQYRWTRISIGPYSGDEDSSLVESAINQRDQYAQSSLERLVAILHDGGISDAEGWDSIQIQLVRWHKIAINATFNPSSVLSGGWGNADMVNDSELRQHTRGCMQEVFDAARKIFGCPFPSELATIDAIIRSTERNKGSKPSMLLDWEAGRPMELEVILGNPIRIAQRYGIQMPRLQTMYGLLRMAAQKRGIQRPRETTQSTARL
ncbi:2-dehydropantoate 2-reductase [Spizellomyces sp. 'palustris']|nr:2-dehydropantoate 2-reductase [Spizellomyces sp. 'palustris']